MATETGSSCRSFSSDSRASRNRPCFSCNPARACKPTVEARPRRASASSSCAARLSHVFLVQPAQIQIGAGELWRKLHGAPEIRLRLGEIVVARVNDAQKIEDARVPRHTRGEFAQLAPRASQVSGLHRLLNPHQA